MSDESEPIEVSKGDVIQVAPVETVKDVFHGKLAFVDEVRNWGVKAHIETFEGDAYLRLAWGTFVVIGPAAFVAMEKAEQ